MEVLDFEIENDKKISVFLVQKENEKFSMEELDNLRHQLEDIDVIFGTIDESLDKVHAFSLIKPLRGNLPLLFEVGMPTYAKGYLEDEINRKQKLVRELEEELMETDINSLKGQNLDSWVAHLKIELKEMEENLDFNLRNQWIVKKIFDHANNFHSKKQVIMHFTPSKYVKGLKRIFEDMDIPVKVINLKKRMVSSIQTIK